MNNHDSACDAPDTTQETGPRRFRLFAGAALLLTAWFIAVSPTGGSLPIFDLRCHRPATQVTSGLGC